MAELNGAVLSIVGLFAELVACGMIGAPGVGATDTGNGATTGGAGATAGE